MNFQSLPVVESAESYVERAFARARKLSGQVRVGKRDKREHARRVAVKKVMVVRDALRKDLHRIIMSYPDFDALPEFYQELARTQLDLEGVKQALGRIHGLWERVGGLAQESLVRLQKSRDEKVFLVVVRGFYGRVSGLFKRSRKAFVVVERARQVLVTFPALKQGLFTVALAGFPNVGKSTLLSRLTSAQPLIAGYAFTTKKLNVGYYREGYREVQVVDTPGSLARFEKMNPIEQQAFLCCRYVAHVIVFVLDPTETYPLDQQELLLSQLRDHDKPVVVYISKVDIADEGVVAGLRERHPGAVTSPDELKVVIKKFLDDE